MDIAISDKEDATENREQKSGCFKCRTFITTNIFFFFLRGYYQSKLLLITNRNKSCIFFEKKQHPLILMYSEHM